MRIVCPQSVFATQPFLVWQAYMAQAINLALHLAHLDVVGNLTIGQTYPFKAGNAELSDAYPCVSSWKAIFVRGDGQKASQLASINLPASFYLKHCRVDPFRQILFIFQYKSG